jgi:hypothetical protein
MKKIALFISMFFLIEAGYCNQDIYNIVNLGNLSARIEINQNNNLATDKAYMSAEFCSYLTNELIPNQLISIEIYTLSLKNRDDFFVSFDHGEKTTYRINNQINKKIKSNELTHKLIAVDSIKDERLVFRYISSDPDYKKLLRFIYCAIKNQKKIESEQKGIKYKWINEEWYFQTIDSMIVNEWANKIDIDKEINKIIANKKYESRICAQSNETIYSYFFLNGSYFLFNKNEKDSTLRTMIDLRWFALNETRALFFINDSIFFITDSKIKFISPYHTLNKNISDYQSIYFSNQNKYAAILTLINYDSQNFHHEINKWIYRPKEDALINVSAMNEKKIGRLCKKTYKAY